MSGGPIDCVIYVDAAHRGTTAGWAALIKGPAGTTPKWCSGPVERAVASSQEAEAEAMVYALMRADDLNFLAQGAVVLMHTDCVELIAALLHRIPEIRQAAATDGLEVPPAKRLSRSFWESEAIHDLSVVLDQTGIQLLLRHAVTNQGKKLPSMAYAARLAQERATT